MTEICNGLDDDCDGEVDEGCDENDADGDGYPVGHDCDDNDAAVHPGAVETCDGLDNDCDGEVDGLGCSSACADDSDCSNGICVDGVCGCLEGFAMCSAECVDLDLDPSNCGACGRACLEGQQCEDGLCLPEPI